VGLSVGMQLQKVGKQKARAHLTLPAQLYSLAHPSSLPIGPVVIQQGTALVAETVLMSDYLWAFMVDDIMDGEITEHCWSDGGVAHLPGKQDQGLAEPRAVPPYKARKKEQTKLKRNMERSQMQQELGTTLKISTLKKFPAHPARVAVKTSFDAIHAEVTAPGWVGQSLSSLPSRVYTLEELTQSFNLKLIPWKGRHVILVLLLPYHLPAF